MRENALPASLGWLTPGGTAAQRRDQRVALEAPLSWLFRRRAVSAFRSYQCELPLAEVSLGK